MMRRIAGMLDAAGHLGVWAGLYVTAAYVCLAQCSGNDSAAADPRALFVVFATSASVYLLDRLKLTDRWLDRADRASHPSRHEFLASHARIVRPCAMLLSAGALVVGLGVHPLLGVVVLGAHVGVVLYAGLPREDARSIRRARIKDMLLIKNGAVSVSITAFAGTTVILTDAETSGMRALSAATTEPCALIVPVAGLFGIILADTMLCDIEDAPADRLYATNTVPALWGSGATWPAASALILVACLLLLGCTARTWTDARMLWPVGLLATQAALLISRPSRSRDIIDVRLPLVGAVVSTIS
jgi:4-hydroxybenzoate polyprenyltransferase